MPRRLGLFRLLAPSGLLRPKYALVAYDHAEEFALAISDGCDNEAERAHVISAKDTQMIVGALTAGIHLPELRSRVLDILIDRALSKTALPSSVEMFKSRVAREITRGVSRAAGRRRSSLEMKKPIHQHVAHDMEC